jgi:RES domain-containing protein
VAIIYASQTRALACLETVVHLNAGGLPLNRYLVELTLPDALWANAQRTTASSLPVGWDAEPAGRDSIRFGDNWIAAGSSALLVVPSVIVPEEFNVLINPAHAGSSLITAVKVRKWLYDARLTKMP